MNLDFDKWVALISVGFPFAAFLWEFAVVGRKRLGYRVQMDTLAADATQSPYAGVLRDMQQDGHTLKDPSFVLLRIENAGTAPIEEGDYLTPDSDPCGIRVTFRERQVAALVVTELSQEELRDSFIRDNQAVPGFGHDNHLPERQGVIRLPKVKLPVRAEYKVLVVLERWPDDQGREPFPKPVFRGAVGGRRRWFDPVLRFFRFKVARTESHVFASRPAWFGIVLLALAVMVQAGLTLFVRDEPAPLDCVGGTLHLGGSTAFAPAVKAAADEYMKLCAAKGARIPVDVGTFQGSGNGVAALEKTGAAAGISGEAGLRDHIAFADGPAEGNHPQILPRPVAYTLFTLVVNEDAKVRNLSLQQVRDIYARKITNWSEVGGADLPVHLVDRYRNSGTRNALEKRVLKGRPVPEADVNDCTALNRNKPGVCEADSTDDLLDRTAAIPGALGYSEVSSVTSGRLVKLRIDDMPPTLDGVENGTYPYWQTEYAYTYGEPPADSVAAAFLRYLTDQGGKDVLRAYGNRPCSETRYPLVCRPT
ncbi:PstS family phosphate ABC transporter substrate-binding protein [Streptomyces sp. NPDC001107]